MYESIIMKCPSCKTEVSENTLICPKCKKVLKLKCHNCGAITKNSTCEKCGTVILNKCYKCGKLNTTNLEKCPKCGMDINASIGLKESEIEEFAVLTIDLTNLDEIKNALRSEKLAQKFKSNIYAIIKKTASQKKLRVQIIDDTLIIRFCKDYSFIESAKSAIDYAIYVAQTVTDINNKLFDAKGLELKVQMAIQKRDVYVNPSEYNSGLNINVVYSSSESVRTFNSIQLVADSYIYQAQKEQYPFRSLSAVCVKDRMIMYFELILSKLLTKEKEEEIDINEIKLPKNTEFEPKEEIDDEILINFQDLHCTFLKTKTTNLEKELQRISDKKLNNPIISIHSSIRLGKLSNITTETLLQIFNDSTIYRFSCSPLNKYNPYGLLKQMILEYNGVYETTAMANPEIIFSVFANKNIQDLLLMNGDIKELPEDMRYTYYEAFTSFIKSIPYKTLFVIDDIENADECSIEILKYIFENRAMPLTGLIVSSNDEFMLHRKIYRLMTAQNYFDIEVTPASNKNIVAYEIQKYINIKDSFFFEKILENTKGSLFYFNQAIKYLEVSGILAEKNGKYEIVKEKMIVIPQEIDELIQRQMKYLQSNNNVFELYSALLLIGEKIPTDIVLKLNIKDLNKILKQLIKLGFINIDNKNTIILNNYNLFKNNLKATCQAEQLETIAQYVLEKMFINIPTITPIKAELLEYANIKKEAFTHWHALAMIASQLGDLCAYLNCTKKFLSLVENVIDPQTNKTVEQVKFEVYSELAEVMYKYYPDKIINFLKTLLIDLETQNDNEKVIEIANKLVQSCLMNGDYKQALEYAGKIIERTPKSSFNYRSKDFSLNYFILHLVLIEIYFNLGKSKDCVELGNEIFQNFDISEFKEKVLPENISKQEFDNVIFDAMFFTTIAKLLTKQDYKKDSVSTILKTDFAKFKCFRLLVIIDEFLSGKDITNSLQSVTQDDSISDKYSAVLLPILYGLSAIQQQNWELFGNYIYNAKSLAAELRLYQIKYLCELLIGFAYKKLGNNKKAKQIYYNILDLASESGIKNIVYLSWYFITIVESEDSPNEMVLNILNNSVLSMENDDNTATIFLVLFKTLSAEILLTSGNNFEKALFCAEQAFDIALKSNLLIYLPKIANILLYIYNVIITNQQDTDVVKEYTQKVEALNQTMSKLGSL